MKTAALLTLIAWPLALAAWIWRARYPSLLYVELVAAPLALYGAIQWMALLKHPKS